MSFSGTPRLYRFAATLLGMATKSAGCLLSSASTRNWSGSFQGMNSTVSATSFKAPLSTMWMSGKETAANGPDKVSFGSLAGVEAAGAAAPGAAAPTLTDTTHAANNPI